MDWIYYLKKLWYKIIYVLLVIIYIIKLDKLNKQLLQKDFDSSFSLLKYNDYEPVSFFVIAMFLMLLAIIFIIRDFNSIRHEENDKRDIIIIICSIIAMFTIILLIIKWISVPILKAILISLCLICGIVYAETS